MFVKEVRGNMKTWKYIIVFSIGSTIFILFMYCFYFFCFYYHSNINSLHFIHAIMGDVDFADIFIAINAPTFFNWSNPSIIDFTLLHIYWILIGGVGALLIQFVWNANKQNRKQGG